MSEVKVNKISPRSGTDVTLGDASDTFTIPASATLDVNGTLDLAGSTMTGFTIPSGQTLTVASGGTITNSGTATGFVAVKVGEFNYIVDTSSGTQAITGVGFQPIALWIFASADRSITPPPVFGASDGTTHGNVSSVHPTADHIWDANTTNLIDIETSAGNTATAVLTSFDADGFTLTWTKTGSPPTSTIIINYWAVK